MARALALLVPLALVALLGCTCRPPSSPAPPPGTGIGAPALGAAPGRHPAGLPGWCVGNTHVHTDNSGDGRTPAEMVAGWYERAGYDFLVITDHNFVTVLDWPGRLVVVPGVEITRNERIADPPPGDDWAPMHVNALFVPAGHAGPLGRPAIERPPGVLPTREEVYRESLALAARLGGLAVLNHPTFRGAVDLALMDRLAAAGLAAFEVANASADVHNEGERGGPSTERLWDSALDAARPLLGFATDDAHHFDDADAAEARGEPAYRPFGGFVAVRAARCAPAELRAALERGEFYASWGPVLTAVERDVAARTLRVSLAAPAIVRFVGPRGEVLGEVASEAKALWVLPPGVPWVRAVVEDSSGRRAWTQALGPFAREAGRR